MSSFVFGGGRGAAAVERFHHHGTPQKEGSDIMRQLQGHLAGSPRRQDTAEDHCSPPQLTASAWESCRKNRVVSDRTVLPI